MTRKRNPYETVTNVIVIGAGVAVILGVLGLVGYLIVDGIIKLGWEFIGAAAFFIGLIALLALLYLGAEQLGKWWMRKSDEWERKNRTPEPLDMDDEVAPTRNPH